MQEEAKQSRIDEGSFTVQKIDTIPADSRPHTIPNSPSQTNQPIAFPSRTNQIIAPPSQTYQLNSEEHESRATGHEQPYHGSLPRPQTMTQGKDCAAMYSLYLYTENERNEQELERLKEEKRQDEKKQRQAEKKQLFQNAFNGNFRW